MFLKAKNWIIGQFFLLMFGFLFLVVWANFVIIFYLLIFLSYFL